MHSGLWTTLSVDHRIVRSKCSPELSSSSILCKRFCFGFGIGDWKKRNSVWIIPSQETVLTSMQTTKSTFQAGLSDLHLS